MIKKFDLRKKCQYTRIHLIMLIYKELKAGRWLSGKGDVAGYLPCLC